MAPSANATLQPHPHRYSTFHSLSIFPPSAPCLPRHVSCYLGGPKSSNTVTSSPPPQSAYLHSPIFLPPLPTQLPNPSLSQCCALTLPLPKTFYSFVAPSVTPLSAPSPLSYVPGCFSIPPASSFFPDSLMVLQWNAGSLQARSDKVLHSISHHFVDLICIQGSSFISSTSVQLHGYSALRSDETHSCSGILSSDDPHHSVISGVIIFVWQGLSFSELFTSFLIA